MIFQLFVLLALAALARANSMFNAIEIERNERANHGAFACAGERREAHAGVCACARVCATSVSAQWTVRRLCGGGERRTARAPHRCARGAVRFS